MTKSLLRYAAWLDGETLRLKRLDRRASLITEQIAIDRALKINAVLGHRIAITDVQMIDSPGLALAFADADFMKVVALDPDWLLLVAREDPLDRRLRVRAARKRARAGLHRSRNPHWTSSAFHKNVGEQREFLSMLLDESSEDFDDHSLEREAVKNGFLRPRPKRVTTSPEEQMRLGAIRALHHFASSAQASDAPRVLESNQNYYRVLKQLAGARSHQLPHDDRAVVDLTLKIIESKVDRDARPFRSALKPALRAARLKAIQSKQVWRTAVVAWNRALSESIGADGTHYPFLRHAVKVPLYMPRETVTSIFSNDDRWRRRASGALKDVREALMDVPYDFSWLSWSRILQIVSNERIRKTRERYLAAQAAGAAEESTRRFKELAKAIADSIVRHSDELPGEGFAWFGAESLLHHVLSIGGARLAVETLRSIARWSDRESIISTLHRFDGRFD